jgi:hypothetical protein
LKRITNLKTFKKRGKIVLEVIFVASDDDDDDDLDNNDNELKYPFVEEIDQLNLEDENSIKEPLITEEKKE